jgi:hypothetical protein
MMSDDLKKVSDELVATWGDKTQLSLLPLKRLLAETLRSQNILGTAFVVECVDGVLAEAVRIATELKAQRGPGPTDSIQ